MPDGEFVRTQRKALDLNLDESIYGSFSEIGAGQEVARWFFLVGAASGTVAKTVCAYDKAVSDTLYGAGTRYVSRPRVEAMLNADWAALQDQVAADRRATTRLFAFADTAAARNYAGTNLCHAWLGVRFQLRPDGTSSEAIMHVNLRDETARGQQETLGILGVSLVHAVFHARETVEQLLDALSEELDVRRIEIDVLDLQGEAFADLDARSVHAALVTRGLTPAVLLPCAERSEPPAEAFYKRPVVLVPGTFEQAETLHVRAMDAASAKLQSEPEAEGVEPLRLCGLSSASDLSLEQCLDRTAALHALGADVVLFGDRELFRMTAVCQRYTRLPIRLGVSVGVVVRVFEETQYERLEGRLLEAIASLFKQNVRLYVFASRVESLSAPVRQLVQPGADGWVTTRQIRPSGAAARLYDYLLDAGFIEPLDAVEDGVTSPGCAS